MAMLTIRNLDDTLKARLRVRAAERNRSMEEEARQILSQALQEPAGPTPDLAQRIRSRFAPLGDVALALEVREPVREPPVFGLAGGSTTRKAARGRAKKVPSGSRPRRAGQR